MIEYRFSDEEVMTLPPDPLMCELFIRLKLSAAGFDMTRISDITMDSDSVNGEFIYRQEEID